MGAASLGEGGGPRSRVPQVTAEPCWSRDSVSTQKQRGVRGVRCVMLIYLLPVIACWKLSIVAVYFPHLFREPKFISHRKNPLIVEFLSRKLLWRECNPHAYLVGGEFEVQEVNSILHSHTRLG